MSGVEDGIPGRGNLQQPGTVQSMLLDQSEHWGVIGKEPQQVTTSLKSLELKPLSDREPWKFRKMTWSGCALEKISLKGAWKED